MSVKTQHNSIPLLYYVSCNAALEVPHKTQFRLSGLFQVLQPLVRYSSDNILALPLLAIPSLDIMQVVIGLYLNLWQLALTL